MEPSDTLPTRVLSQGQARGLFQKTPPAHLSADLRAQLSSFVTDRPNWDGVVAIGDARVHHWVHISAAEAVSMMGFLTPHLIAQLDGSGHAETIALTETMARPERLAAHLRAAQISQNATAVTGHLVGAELAAAKVYWLGQEVVLLGGHVYLEPLEAQGAAVSLR